jgi:chromosome segregation protein
MFLKRLEAFGFKSFADKVVFDFEPGFTCLVGPNGCGKSNVVDAVKWVLGEQSAKSLRGGEMLDIIFNGSAHRKPLNYCEVTLIFDNDSGTLPLAAPEVAVTRRLFRSGESEYLINKALCRLRDIRELLWDTGIGTSSYSIIEQGRIGLLLEANSKERRVLFEEAAGIHKYKERKKIALRKLERVEQNLARLNDVILEVDRSLRSVTRQAERARKAQELTGQLRQIRLDLFLNEAHACQTALREVEGELAGAREQVAALAGEVESAQAGTATEQDAMARLDVELSAAQAQLSAARADVAALEEAIKAGKRASEEMQAEAARARRAAQEAGNRAAALAAEREKAELDLVRVREALTQSQEQVRLLAEVLAADQKSCDETCQALGRARQERYDLIGRRTQLQQALSQAEAAVGGIDYRLRKSRAEVSRAEDLLRLAQSEAEGARGRLDELQRRREALETEQLSLRGRQAEDEEEIGLLNQRAQELRTELEKSRSRVAVLEELQQTGEGLAPGPRAVLTGLRDAGVDGGDLLGLVADGLGVDPRLEAAIEAALGPAIEALVVGRTQTAQRLMARLREDGLGRASFLALDRLSASPGNSGDTILFPRLPGNSMVSPELPGFLGRAAELVTCEPEYRVIAEALLGNVLVFDTFENAEAARAGAPDGGTRAWVSLAGDVLERNGALSGGQHRRDRVGPFGRRNEIARLAAEMDLVRLRLSTIAERTAGLEKRAQQLARDDERIAADLAALLATATELKGVLAAIQREEERSTEVHQVAAGEIRELEAERASYAERIVKLREEEEAHKQQEAALQAREEELTKDLSFREESLTRRRAALEEVRREVSTLSERAGGLERHGQALSAQFAERRDEADREARRGEALDARRRNDEAELAEQEARRERTAERIGTLETQTAALAGEKDQARSRFEAARARERALAQQLDQARTQAGEIERRQFELKLRLDTKLETVRAEFQLDAAAELAARGGPPQVPPEAAAKARALEERLQRLGPVNLFALEEQRQLEERGTFLKTQADDLNSARASLRDVIARINRRSRKQFQETFEAVRVHFQEIFRKLFGGGKADLILEEGEDILEAGIEIVARPPGKEPRSIMQLSGGEKAMTTIALLFAVFRSRPAPFCLLDEVDAPLDEANVDRFNLILREFMDRSQFLVITHNKRTMSYADVLYGITMPEPGVSKRIAIRYQEIEKHLPMEQIEAQARAAREAALTAAEEAVPATRADDASEADAGSPGTPAEVAAEESALVAGGGGG